MHCLKQRWYIMLINYLSSDMISKLFLDLYCSRMFSRRGECTEINIRQFIDGTIRFFILHTRSRLLRVRHAVLLSRIAFQDNRSNKKRRIILTTIYLYTIRFRDLKINRSCARFRYALIYLPWEPPALSRRGWDQALRGPTQPGRVRKWADNGTSLSQGFG